MYILLRKNWLDFLGRLTGVFLCSYGLVRFLVETVRQPDAHIGLFAGGFSIGQILSLPMILFGLYLLLQSWRQEQNHGK